MKPIKVDEEQNHSGERVESPSSAPESGGARKTINLPITMTKEGLALTCDKCPRTFKTQGALNGHQRSHSFFNFLGKQMPKEFREREREETQVKIIMAAIKHYGQSNDESHCDVCAVVYEAIDKPLFRDLAAYFASEGK